MLAYDVTSQMLYAGTDDGVFRSADGAERWIHARQSPMRTSIKALALDPANPRIIMHRTVGTCS
jgi:hypothetical protein